MVIICIDGVIAAGKITLVENLHRHYTEIGQKCVHIKEPVELWIKTGILQKYYKDPAKYAFIFQQTVLTDLINLYTSIEWDENTIYILERGVHSTLFFFDILHEAGTVTNEQHKTYL